MAPNYAPEHSWDFVGNDPDPAYYSDGTGFWPHPAAVAGIAGARGGNGIGVTGAAPHARLASIAAFDEAVWVQPYDATVDENFAGGLMHHTAADETGVNIYNLSANPSHGLAYTDYPMIDAALDVGTSQGGIYVQAAGNYGHVHGIHVFGHLNNVPVNGDTGKQHMTNRPEVIVVAGVGFDGVFAEYSSFGSSVFVSAPTLETFDGDGLGVTTTDVTHPSYGYNYAGTGEVPFPDGFPDYDYTSTFGGTSAATPLVSGILALAKEAQPNLDTRFAKHLLARTSRVVDPNDATATGGWITNGAGLGFNNNYGFGLVDADALTLETENYSGVTDLREYSTGAVPVNTNLPNNNNSGVTRTFVMPEEGSIEEVEVRLRYKNGNGISGNDSYFASGDIEAVLTSPSGTASRLMFRNALMDYSRSTDTEINWTYLSNAFWGEELSGEWQLNLYDLAIGPTFTFDAVPTRWVEFEVNFRTGSLWSCDFTDDQVCDVSDLDLMHSLGPLSDGVSADGLEEFDLNGDGVVDVADRDVWLTIGETEHGFTSPYKLGDANLDGVVDGSDFNRWNSAKFTDSLLWSDGDWNADGIVDISDFNVWNQNKFTSSDVTLVPEPEAALGAVLGLLSLLSARRRLLS